MMKTSSCKAKGRNLQNLIAKELLEGYYSHKFIVRDSMFNERGQLLPEYKIKDNFYKATHLVADDIKPAIMGESGVDIKFSPSAKKIIPWDVECKNQENWSIPSWWKQTIANTKEGRKPLLVIKKNHQEPLVVMRWSDFKELL